MKQRYDKNFSGDNSLYIDKIQIGLTFLGILITFLLTYIVYQYAGIQFICLLWTGFLIGFSLFHIRFGFSIVYRRLLQDGKVEMLYAHLIMLATATTFFALIFRFNLGAFGTEPAGAVLPIGINTIIGGFIFGFGMQIGSGLAPDSLYSAHRGRTALSFTLIGFMAGSVIGAAHFHFWALQLPSFPAVSLIKDTGFGYFGAWLLTMAAFGSIAIFAFLFQPKDQSAALAEKTKLSGWKRVLFGIWPLWAGALIMASLNALTLVIQGTPWKVTSAFTLWGAKIVMFLGIDVDHWEYWETTQSVTALHSSIFSDSISVLNIGIIIGTFVALSLRGLIKFHKVPIRVGFAALAGGMLMGYGACLTLGANIGTYFSGIASFSLHGWIWAFIALIGAYFGLQLRPFFTRHIPKSTDKP